MITWFALLLVTPLASAVQWDYGWQILCARCGAFGEDSGDRCHYSSFIHYQPTNRVICHRGCVHISGKVTDPTLLNEAWRREFENTLRREGVLPNYAPEGPFITGQEYPLPPREERLYADKLDEQLRGASVVLKLCDNELGLTHDGCEQMSLNGVDGTFCKCNTPMCNALTSDELDSRLNDAGRLE